MNPRIIPKLIFRRGSLFWVAWSVLVCFGIGKDNTTILSLWIPILSGVLFIPPFRDLASRTFAWNLPGLHRTVVGWVVLSGVLSAVLTVLISGASPIWLTALVAFALHCWAGRGRTASLVHIQWKPGANIFFWTAIFVLLIGADQWLMLIHAHPFISAGLAVLLATISIMLYVPREDYRRLVDRPFLPLVSTLNTCSQKNIAAYNAANQGTGAGELHHKLHPYSLRKGMKAIIYEIFGRRPLQARFSKIILMLAVATFLVGYSWSSGPWVLLLACVAMGMIFESPIKPGLFAYYTISRKQIAHLVFTTALLENFLLLFSIATFVLIAVYLPLPPLPIGNKTLYFNLPQAPFFTIGATALALPICQYVRRRFNHSLAIFFVVIFSFGILIGIAEAKVENITQIILHPLFPFAWVLIFLLIQFLIYHAYLRFFKKADLTTN